jgi:hypothetical protein
MCTRLHWVIVVIAYIVVLCLTLPLWSESSARLDGTVTDPTQAVVPGAKVVLTNVESGLKYETTTNGAGIFVFPFVSQGTYKMVVSKTGFTQASLTEISLHADDRRSVNVSLSVTGGEQNVEVSAAATAVPVVSTGAKAETLTSQEIQDLSAVGRNSLELMTLLPGVVTNSRPEMSSATRGVTGFKGVDGVSVNGQREDMNSYKLDGGNMLDLTGNNGNDVYPNMDMISEITVKTNSYTADQDNSPTVIIATTKAGTKNYHGEAYWYGRNAFFNANDWSSNNAGIKRPASTYNYPGFNIGGPLVIPGTNFNKNRDKLFFFFGTEYSMQKPDNGTVMAVVPSEKMLQGDFSEIVLSPTCLANPTGRYLGQPCNIMDPLTGKTLAEQNGIITGVTASGPGLLKQLMGPNYAGPNYNDPTGQWNWASDIVRPQNTMLNVLRFDYNPNSKTQIFVRLARQSQKLYEDYGLYGGPGSTWTSGVAEPTPTVSPYHSRSLSFNIVNVISPTFTNEFSFNTNGLWQPNHYQDPSLLSKANLGVTFTGVFPDAVSPTVPQISDGWKKHNNFINQGGNPGTSRQGVGNLDSALGAFYRQTVFQWSDNLSKVVGKHNLRFGGTIMRGRNDQNASDITEGLLVTCDGYGAGCSTGAEFSDIVTERFVQYTQNSDRNLYGRFRFSNFEWYAQDSWKVTPRFTLEYGVRWAFMPPWTEAAGVAAAFDPTIYDPARSSDPYDGLRIAAANPICGQGPFPVCGSIPNGVVSAGHPLTQPRIGFAWDTFGTGKFVLRGGFGQYTQRDQGNSVYKGMIQNRPYNVQMQVSDWSARGMSLATIDAYGTSAGAQIGNNIWTRDLNDHHMPAIYEYNLTISTQLPKQLNLELSYVGSQSRHLLQAIDMNAPAPGSMWLPGTHITQQWSWTADTPFRPYPTFGQIDSISHSGNANYNSLQATLRRQVGHGLDLLATYTYGKDMGYSSYFEDLVDPFDKSHMYRPLEMDRTHLLSLAYMYHVPKLARGFLSDSKIARGALDGWMISGITRFTSGGPFTIQVPTVNCVGQEPNNPCVDPSLGWLPNANPNGLNWQPTSSWFGTTAYGETYGMGYSVVHPQFTCNPVSSSHDGLNKPWINVDCVTLPAFGEGGAWVEPYMKGPGYQNFDIAIMKSFMMGERKKLQFRLSMFNMFNHAQLNTPNNTAQFNWNMPVGATDFSQGTPELLNGTGGCANGQLGMICGKTGHREMELAVRFYF